MDRIKSLIEYNLYGKNDKLLENFSFDDDSKNLAKEFDEINESINTIMEGPLSGFFGSLKQGWNAFQNDRLMRKADAQLAKAVAKDASKLNAAIGVMASALARRINRLGEVGKTLSNKIKGSDEATAAKIQAAVDAKIKDAQEFLSRVMAAKDNLLADATTDPKKAAQLGQQAAQKEKKADAQAQQADAAKQQAASTAGAAPEAGAEAGAAPEAGAEAGAAPEAGADAGAGAETPDSAGNDVDQMASKLQSADDATKQAAKKEIQSILKVKGRDLLIPILKKSGIDQNSGVLGENVEIEEREARGIINPSVIAKLLSSDAADRPLLKAFQKLSRGKQNGIARQLEKSVMGLVSKTEIGQQLLKAPEAGDQPAGIEGGETPAGVEGGETPAEEPINQIDVNNVRERNADKVVNILTKVTGRNNPSANQAVATKIIKSLVDEYNKTGSATQTINAFANSEYGKKFGNDAKQLAIQALDGIVDLNKESLDKPIVEEIRRRLRKKL